MDKDTQSQLPPKKPLLNKTFFKFAVGFVGVLLASFIALFATSYFEREINTISCDKISTC